MAPIAPLPPVPPLDQIAQAQSLTAGMLQATGQASASQASPLASFQNFFAEAAGYANAAATQAQRKEENLVVSPGKGTDGLADTFISMEKADLSFQLTMAIRDKVISAYQTIMQMSV
jgi:flagellar hook-basal body complex protein FliE